MSLTRLSPCLLAGVFYLCKVCLTFCIFVLVNIKRLHKMPLPKGQTNNPNGRPKGSKNERTEQWEALSESIVTKHAERFNKALEKLNDKEFISSYIQVLNYFKPKYQSTEHKVSDNNKITVVYESEPIPTSSETETDKEGS